MTLGRLSGLVADMPSWVEMMIDKDELDLNPPGGFRYQQPQPNSNRELLEALDRNVAKARAALEHTTEEHLLTPWRFKVAGRVVSEQPRYIMIRDAVFNHLAHHRGQLTVYLRLNEMPVPAIYGPTADEGSFA
jgi:uncharacterized damage-inducible protein DinB